MERIFPVPEKPIGRRAKIALMKVCDRYVEELKKRCPDLISPERDYRTPDEISIAIAQHFSEEETVKFHDEIAHALSLRLTIAEWLTYLLRRKLFGFQAI